MQLALADNAIAHKKAQHNTVPRLRACFHVGSSYEFHQSEGLNPTLYNYIVGDVTVDLARVIERAMPGQILVGDFRAEMPTVDAPGSESRIVESADFVELAMRNVEQLAGHRALGRARRRDSLLSHGHEARERRVHGAQDHRQRQARHRAPRLQRQGQHLPAQRRADLCSASRIASLGPDGVPGVRQRARAAAGARLTAAQCELVRATALGRVDDERRIRLGVVVRCAVRVARLARSGP